MLVLWVWSSTPCSRSSFIQDEFLSLAVFKLRVFIRLVLANDETMVQWFYTALLQNGLEEMNSTSRSVGKTKMICPKHN